MGPMSGGSREETGETGKLPSNRQNAIHRGTKRRQTATNSKTLTKAAKRPGRLYCVVRFQ